MICSRGPSLIRAAGVGLAAALVACAHAPSAQRSHEATVRAADLRSQNKMQEAAAAYTEALNYDPTNIPAIRGYVEVQHLVGKAPVAVARFRQAVAVHPGDAYAHEGLGLALFSTGGGATDECRAELTRAAELAPNIADFQYRLGLFFVESDRYEDAVKALAKAIALDGHKARYRLPYALSLARTGDQAGAVRELTTVLSLAPNADEVTLAEKTAKNLIDPFRGFPQAAREQWDVAYGWLDHDSPAQAQQVLESLLQKYPDIAIVHALSGLTALRMDDASRAIYELRRAIELAPDLAEPRLYLGDIYASRGRPDNAREHYVAAIERNPFLADAYKRLAEVDLHGGDQEGAAKLYTTYLLLKPTDVDAVLAHAKVLTDLKRPEAATAWDDGADQFPSRVDVLVGRGRYYFEQAATSKDPSARTHARTEAEKSLEKAVDVDPENATAAAILSQLRKLP